MLFIQSYFSQLCLNKSSFIAENNDADEVIMIDNLDLKNTQGAFQFIDQVQKQSKKSHSPCD